MEDEYITVKTAMLAKQKGFNEPCRMFYHSDTIEGKTVSSEIKESTDYTKNDIPVPAQSLLVRWFRETKELHIEVEFWCYMGENYCEYTYNISKPHEGVDKDVLWFNTYEEAMEAGLQEALKLIF